MTAVHEEVAVFGDERDLVGILTTRTGDRAEAGLPAVVFWSTYEQHRIGPYRAYVDLARELGQRGFSSLRFDPAGVGDTGGAEPQPGTSPKSDIDAAMRCLQAESGATRFVLVAFGSEAVTARAMALSDSHIAGIVCIDGYRFDRSGFKLLDSLRLLDPKRWERWLWARSGAPQGLLPGAGARRIQPPPDRLRAEFVELGRRGTRSLLVFFGRETGYTRRDQIFDELSDRSLASSLDVLYYRSADPTFFLGKHRTRAIEDIADWALSTFGLANAGARRAV